MLPASFSCPGRLPSERCTADSSHVQRQHRRYDSHATQPRCSTCLELQNADVVGVCKPADQTSYNVSAAVLRATCSPPGRLLPPSSPPPACLGSLLLDICPAHPAKALGSAAPLPHLVLRSRLTSSTPAAPAGQATLGTSACMMLLQPRVAAPCRLRACSSMKLRWHAPSVRVAPATGTCAAGAACCPVHGKQCHSGLQMATAAFTDNLRPNGPTVPGINRVLTYMLPKTKPTSQQSSLGHHSNTRQHPQKQEPARQPATHRQSSSASLPGGNPR
jgi:hypothetical protein